MIRSKGKNLVFAFWRQLYQQFPLPRVLQRYNVIQNDVRNLHVE